MAPKDVISKDVLSKDACNCEQRPDESCHHCDDTICPTKDASQESSHLAG